MGLIKTLVIIALIILAAAYFFPTQFAEVKNNVLGDKIGKGLTTNTNYQQLTNVGTIGDQDYEDGEEEQIETNETEETNNEEVDLSTEQAEVCDRLYSDYPDYYGTTKWGQDCTDGIIPDEECLEYPPERYAGEIDTTTMESNPQLNCCLTDGKCYWG